MPIEKSELGKTLEHQGLIGDRSKPPMPVDVPRRQSLVDLFHEFSKCQAEYLQYDDGYRSWKYTYAQVGLAAQCFASRLGEQNIGKGDKVIFWSENRPEWIAAFWGCVLAGVIVVPIDYRTSTEFLRHLQEIVEARLILVGEEVHLSTWDRQPPACQLSELEWSTGNFEAPQVRLDRDDVAEIVFTSGATGEPKGVLITHGNILANIVSPEQIVSKYAKWFRPVFPVRFLSLIPLSHMFGQILTLFILPLIPSVAVFMRGFSPQEIAQQIRTRRISVVVAVPKILQVLRKHVLHQFPEAARLPQVPTHWVRRWYRYSRIHSLFGWKYWAFIVGGAPLAKELEEFWSGLGFAVIQGYGLTETAPLVAFNNPFDSKEGTVGKPIAGVEVKIAPGGEILVRGGSVTPGYFQASVETAAAFEDGWFHTGDLGSFDSAGNLIIQGRKKEMIVTPEGLKVFPEDVEVVLNEISGVRESAVVGRDHVHAVLVLENACDPNEVVRRANLRLENHQKIRSISIWPGERLPRTESTQKLRHGEIQTWVESGGSAPTTLSGQNMIDLLRKYAPDRAITPNTTLDELGLSSLDRVELMIDLEQDLDTSVDESLLTGARKVAELAEVGAPPGGSEFPVWNRIWLAKTIRNVALSAVWLPLTRLFAHAHVTGQEHLASLRGPVIFAPNHQSHLDTPLILSALPARYRYRIAVAMWKEYFDAHFSPERHTGYERFRDSLTYGLVALFFNAFPIPQTDAGARQSLRYIGDLVNENWSILFFPEGERTEAGEIKSFRPGVGLMARRLGVSVVPIRLRGVEKILHRHAHWPRPGHVELAFGAPLHLKGEDYAALAKQVEEAVRAL
jgi:long-chain acyl-CoA synthetase